MFVCLFVGPLDDGHLCLQSDILATPPLAPDNNSSPAPIVLTQDNQGYFQKPQQTNVNTR